MTEDDILYRVKLLDELSPVLKDMLGKMKTETEKGSRSLEELYATAKKGGGIIRDLGKELLQVADNMGEEAYQLNRFRQQMGASITQVQEWAKIADETGTSMGSLAVGFRGLGISVEKALKDPTSDAAIAFKALGVQIKDANGKARDSQAVMYDVANAFAAAKDGNEKNAIAMTLFNRAGREMIPVLNQGAEGLKGMAQAAHDTGQFMDEQTFGAALRYREAINDIKDNVEGMHKEIAGPLLLRLANLTKALSENAGGVHSWTRQFGEGIGWMADFLATQAINAKAGAEHILNFITNGFTGIKGTFKELIGSMMSGLGQIEDYFMTSSVGRYLAGQAGIEATGGMAAAGQKMAYEGAQLKRQSRADVDAEIVNIESRRLAGINAIKKGITYKQPKLPGGGDRALDISGAEDSADDGKAAEKAAKAKAKALAKIDSDARKDELKERRRQDAEDLKLEAEFHAKERKAEQAEEAKKIALERRLMAAEQKVSRELLKSKYDEELFLLRENKDAQIRLTAEYNGAMAQQDADDFNRKVATTEKGLRAVGRIAGQVMGENNAITKAAALGEGWINYRRAVMGAMASPPFPPKNAPMVAAAKIQGGIELALLAAQTLTGGGGGGSSGGSSNPVSFASDSSPSVKPSTYSPEVPTPSRGAAMSSAPDVRLTLVNPIMQDRWIRENVFPSIDEALRDRVSRTLMGSTVRR
jgi:hypothetical protein